MPTGYGTIYNDGVKYIKINKFDIDGTDKSDYLAQMNSIRINHPDIGVRQYNIATNQVQNDYFIFGVSNPQQITSSLGDVNNYGFTSSKANVESATLGSLVKVKNYSTTVGNILNYFNPTTGVYTFGDTPNIPVKFTLNISNVANPATTHSIYKNSTSDTYSTMFPVDLNNRLGLVIGNGSISIVLTGSNYLTENETLAVYTFNLSDPASATVSMSIYNVTPPFNGSSSLILFNPDVGNFDYNDYNALLNNADIPQYSTTWMDVDYSQNPLVPINLSLIMSGTANKAFVQDSNYSSKAWSNLRYNGSKTNSFRYI
jgi:hypothetical protein